MRAGSTQAILTRHFLRRFLENDLIAPDADRAQLLAVVGASLFSTTIFITVVTSFKYVVGYYTPGQAAVAALDDRFFYIALSMVVVALIAVAQWDALAVDTRDAAILDPLPVRPLAVRRAKLTAVALFGGAAAALVNLAATVIFPLLVLVKQRVGIGSALVLIVTHAAIVLSAAAFGFLSVIALRETLAAVCGPRGFARISPWVQGTLIVALGTALLLLPAASAGFEQHQLHQPQQVYSPPAWFLGAYEELAGSILIDAPRQQLNNRMREADVAPSAAYRRDAAIFADLAGRVPIALVTITLTALIAYFVNARRPAGIPRTTPRRQRWRLAGALPWLALLRDTTAIAGFDFTLAALWRSSTHRLTIACCGAAALAMSLVALSGIDFPDTAGAGRVTQRLLIVQPFLMGLLLVGFRHVIRVPAELRANWGFQLAWRGSDRPFVTGARRAALVALVIPALAAVFVVDAVVLGPWLALAHALLGLAGAVMLLEVLMVGYDKVPFTCSYLPSENMKALGPLYLLMFLVGATAFAGMETTALRSGDPTRLLVTLAVAFAVFRIFSRTRPRLAAIDFDEVPTSTQKLGLNA